MPTIANSLGATPKIAPPVALRTRGTTRRRKPTIAFPARYRNRPALIRQAIYRTWDVADQIQGTKTAIALLQAIISCVNRNDLYSPVFAKKEKLALMAEISEASVYRGLKFLAEGKWIEKLEQYRHMDGTLDIGEICITQKLASLLGLVDDNVRTVVGDSGQQDDVEDEIPTDNTGCQIRQGNDEKTSPAHHVNSSAAASNSPHLTVGLRGGCIYRVDLGVDPKASVNHQSTQPAFVRMDGRSVPVELAWLINEKRLTYGQLFELMKLAKKVPGQKLTDFVTLRTSRLKELLSTRDCYFYLKGLIAQGIDAKFLCAQQQKACHRVIRKQQREKASAAREGWVRAHDGKTYVDDRDGKTFTINANHNVLIVGQGGLPSNEPNIPLNSRFIRDVEGGRLKLFVPPVIQKTDKPNLWAMIGFVKGGQGKGALGNRV